MKIFITGGAGYVGSMLIPYLLDKGYSITNYDLYLYEDTLKKHKNLKEIKGDIRDRQKLIKSSKNHDMMIHLACVSNDPSYELNPELSKTINLDSIDNILDAIKINGIDRLIYASTSSVYGISNKANVREEDLCKPLTDYSRHKLECEYIIDSHITSSYTIVRPATICGYSPRLRLDLVLNALTINALETGVIKIFGGKQIRANLNIKDMVRAYECLIEADSTSINGEVFNVGFKNVSVEDLANIVKEKIESKIEYIETDDKRSYHINSDKIRNKLGFVPKYDLYEAIDSLSKAYKNGLIKDGLHNPLYHNVKMMKLKENILL